jgi:hypothetical protein
MGESFADLKRRSLMAKQEKPTQRFATGGAVPDRAKSKTVETTGKAADREMQAMERQVAAAKPQRKAAGGMAVRMPKSLAQAPPAPLAPMPLPGSRNFGAMSLMSMRPSALPSPNPTAAIPSPSTAGAKRGGRQVKKGPEMMSERGRGKRHRNNGAEQH